jgi:cell division septal protein FtsQ
MKFNPFAKRRYRPKTARPRDGIGFGRIMLRLLVLSLMAGILACLVSGGALLYKFMYHSQYFKVRDVILAGADADLAVKNQIERCIRQQILKDGILLKVDEMAVKDLLEGKDDKGVIKGIPKVKRAIVAKQYPNRLLVGVTLRQAVAFVLNDPILAIDEEGYAMESIDVRHRRVMEFPFITGLDKMSLAAGHQIQSEALTKALLLLSCLENKAPVLFAKISEVHCDEQEGLTLLMKGGTEIRFGNGNPIEKMPAFDTFVQKYGAPDQFAYIDLRWLVSPGKGQVSFMMRPAAKTPQAALPRQ